LYSATDLSKAIASIGRRGAKLDTDIQRAACSALALGIESGTWNWCGDLLNAMPQGSRAQTLAAWMAAHAPVSLAKKGKLWVARKNQKFDGVYDADQCAADFWWEYQKDKPEKQPFSLEDLREMLGKVAEQKGRYSDAQTAAVAAASVLVAQVDELIARSSGVETA
jgi:hypothetical protein